MSEELRTTDNDDLVSADPRELETADKMSRVRDELRTADPQEEVALEKPAGDKRAVDNQSRNRTLVTYWALPFMFLTVALLGGLRLHNKMPFAH